VTWPGKNGSPTAPAVGGLFFPQDHALGVDRCGFSPRVQQKIVHAGVNSLSYQQASRDLAELSDLDVKPKPVERLVRKIGRERIDQRDAAVAAHQRLPLMAKDVVADLKRSTPSVAMASVDGGRMQIRSDPSEPSQESHWRESKVAVLETYQSAVHDADPDPDVPRCFLDLKRTTEVVRGLGHDLPVGLDLPAEVEAALQDFDEVVGLALENTLVMDRLEGTGHLTTRIARDHGVLGYVARASGIDADVRRDRPRGRRTRLAV
jgi:hypothetical protein